MLDSLAEPFSTVESAAGARAAADIGGRPVRLAGGTWPQACSAALGAVAVTIVGFDDGGYFSATWIWMTVCFAAVAAIGAACARDSDGASSGVAHADLARRARNLDARIAPVGCPGNRSRA